MPLRLVDCTFGYLARRPVLQDFSLSFPPGRTVLLGPNGAGKSTILSLCASILRPTAGRVTFDELDTTRRRDLRTYRRRVGWLPQSIRPISGLRVREQVAYAGWLKGMSRAQAWEASADALAKVGLTHLATRPTRALSGGQMRRMGIAQALVHDADVLLLDEPAAGLDPQQRRRLREVVNDVSATSSVIVSTHHTDDITDAYDCVVVLSEGEVRFIGSVQDFLALAPEASNGTERAAAAYQTLVGDED
jgi:ABC-type multidrug transport system ATPase subunit